MNRAHPLLTLLAIAALAAACEKTPEVAPADAGPLVRDVVAVDAADVSPTDAPPTDAPPTDAPPTDAPPTDAPPTDVTAADASTSTDVASTDVTDAVAVDGARDGGCAGDGGCWACAPSLPEHFVNGCTASACAPFDNRARLTRLLGDGGLPPLP